MTSLSSLLLTAFLKSSTFSLLRWQSLIQKKKTIILKSKYCSYFFVFDVVTDLLFNKKMFIIEWEDNSFLCLLNYLLYMTLYNDVFVVKSLKDVNNIFWVKILLNRKCLQLKMKHRTLNIFIFHESEYTEDEYCTSFTKLLCSSTWLHYL